MELPLFSVHQNNGKINKMIVFLWNFLFLFVKKFEKMVEEVKFCVFMLNKSIVTSEYGFKKVGYGITPTSPTSL